MERLTDCAQGYCELYCKSYGLCRMDPEICAKKNEAALYAKLKDYEITGLNPDEVVAMRHTLNEYQKEADPLLRAKVEGRLVVLPCKVGDTAYILRLGKKGVAVREVRVEDISISAKGFAILKFGFHYDSAFANDIGKSWFLTREEAEAALAKDKNVPVIDINVGNKEGGESDG